MMTRPNVILLVLDAVRADHLSCYGYHRKTSPNIDNIAKHGVLFENAFSTAEWSPPSHASIFTGKYPSFHGTLGKDLSLKEGNTTIAEILNKNGYRTVAITNNLLVAPINRFGKGFQDFIEMEQNYRNLKFLTESPKDFFRTFIYGIDQFSYRTVEKFRRLLDDKSMENIPFFLFINFFNCHAPYDPPRPFKTKFCSSLSRSRFYILEAFFNKIFGTTTERIRGNSLNIRKLRYIANGVGQFAFMAGDLQISEEEWEVVRSWYDGEISYLDYRLGEFVNLLRDKGIFDNTLLIITSDHGENIGAHGLGSHHFCLYDSLIHVPLIMTCPNLIPEGVRIRNIVSTIDIFPTILDVLRIKDYKNGIQGESLHPFKDRKIHDFVCAESGKSVRFAFDRMRQQFGNRLVHLDKGLKCLRSKSYKYIISSDKKEELYDIRKDPSEEVDISRTHPEKVENFRRQLQNAIDISFFGPDEITREKHRGEILKRLQKLGYI